MAWAVLLHAIQVLASEYDAAFVRMEVPDAVMAHEVFPVTITVRNTGTQAWEGWPIRLRSMNPPNNLTWGTDYLLIAQGTTVKPGDEYTFRSNLRAPGRADREPFQWRVCKDGTLWFGQATPVRTVAVRGRPRIKASAPEPAIRSSKAKPVLGFDHFDYIGSFKPPKTVSDARGAFSETGVAFRSMPDGRDRLWMNYTHPSQVLFEVEMPDLVKIPSGDHSGLPTAEVKQVWGSVSLPQPDGESLSPNGGLLWVEEKRTLLWTWYHGYKTGEAPPVLGASRLSDDGQVTSCGPWRVSAPGGLYKSHWGGVIQLPATFADQYTRGNRLALGFGGYYSICGAASRGPALGAIPEPDPEQSSVPVTPLLYHPHDSPAQRDGDYFNANCGFWSEQPADPEHGTWTYDDWCRGGVFIDLPSGHGYIAFVRLGTGRLGYDFGTITSAGSAEYWYCYDPDEMGKAALDKKRPWKIAPHSQTKVSYPLGRTVTGACFDARTRQLYLCLSWAYPDGRESYPIIHVYRVK